MLTPFVLAQAPSRPAQPSPLTRLTCLLALGTVLGLPACSGMEMAGVPQCSVLQPNCSSFGPAAAAPQTAAPPAPATAAVPRPPSAASAPGAASMAQ